MHLSPTGQMLWPMQRSIRAKSVKNIVLAVTRMDCNTLANLGTPSNQQLFLPQTQMKGHKPQVTDQVPDRAHLGPEGDGVVLVGEPAPAGLHAFPVDGLVHKAGAELQRLLAGAVHGAELRADDAVQRVRQLLEAPVCQVPAHNHQFKLRISVRRAKTGNTLYASKCHIWQFVDAPVCQVPAHHPRHRLEPLCKQSTIRVHQHRVL